MSNEKQRPKCVNRRVGIYINYESLESVVRTLTAAMEKYGKDACLEITEGPYEGLLYEVVYQEEETEAEKEKRLEREAQTEKYQRAQYEALKKKFG